MRIWECSSWQCERTMANLCNVHLVHRCCCWKWPYACWVKNCLRNSICILQRISLVFGAAIPLDMRMSGSSSLHQRYWTNVDKQIVPNIPLAVSGSVVTHLKFVLRFQRQDERNEQTYKLLSSTEAWVMRILSFQIPFLSNAVRAQEASIAIFSSVILMPLFLSLPDTHVCAWAKAHARNIDMGRGSNRFVINQNERGKQMLSYYHVARKIAINGPS